MTVKIEIEAASLQELFPKVLAALGVKIVADTLVAIGTRQAILDQLSEPPAPVEGETVDVPVAPPAENSAAVSPAPRRGRPRKNAQPAVAENTGSTAVAELPATEPAATNAAGIESPKVGEGQAPVGRQDPEPQSSLTHDLVKAKLQDVMHAAKDQNAGMAAAYEIVKKYGYTHVRDIKPEHFAAVFADAEAKLPKEPRL